MYHISWGKGRCREKAILAYSKRHTRRLCLSTTEYLSQAGGESKPLCAFTTKNMLLFKMETSKNSMEKRRNIIWVLWSCDMYLSEVSWHLNKSFYHQGLCIAEGFKTILKISCHDVCRWKQVKRNDKAQRLLHFQIMSEAAAQGRPQTKRKMEWKNFTIWKKGRWHQHCLK